MTHSPARIAQILASHDIAPSRALGQNFVIDPNTVRRIARLSGVGKGTPVVEIGAGLGSLTLALAELGADVVAIELDAHLAPILREIVEPVGVRVVEADALTLNWKELLGQRNDWCLVANLPYNIATPLVLDLLDDVPEIAKMLVMVQREAGERLAAHVGDKAYGAVSVKVDYWARARVIGLVPPTVFIPKPKVDSALVEIVRRMSSDVTLEGVTPKQLFEIVHAGFAQRRKMLRASLRAVMGDGALQALELAGVDPTERAERLDVEAWSRLAAACVKLRLVG